MLDLLLYSRLHQSHKTHPMVFPHLITFLCRKQMGKEAYLLFTVLFGMIFGGLLDHKSLIVALFLSILSHMYCRGPWVFIWSELAAGMFRSLEQEYKK